MISYAIEFGGQFDVNCLLWRSLLTPCFWTNRNNCKLKTEVNSLNFRLEPYSLSKGLFIPTANFTINVAQGMDVFNQPSIPGPRPAPLILPTGVLPPLSSSVHDVTCRPRFVFPSQRSSSFPPVHELLNLCEEELRTIRNQESLCTEQESPTQSYYADSESERSNINTPATTDERFFVFPDVPATPDQRMQLPLSGAFSFETEVISNTNQSVRFY